MPCDSWMRSNRRAAGPSLNDLDNRDTRRGHLKTRTRTRWVKFVGRTSCPSRIEFEPLSPAWTDKMSALHLVGLRHSLASSVRLKPSLRLRITNRLAEDIRRAIAFF